MSVQLAMERPAEAGLIVLDSDVPEKVIWPVAGGKGGTGKSSLTANIGIGLALLGHKVIIVDGDLGGADLHLFFDQIAPSKSLHTFLSKEVERLEDVLIPTPHENLSLVCGGHEMVGMANMPFLTKEKLKRHILDLDADYVMIDLGAGTSFNTLDLFGVSECGIIVCTPEPQARVDAYGFVKNFVYRKLRRHFAKDKETIQTIDRFAFQAGRRNGRIRDLVNLIGDKSPDAADATVAILDAYRPKLILNKVRSKRQVDQVPRFLDLVRDFLSIELEYVGFVRSDSKFLDACERRRPLLIDSPKAMAARDLCELLMSGLNVDDKLHRFSSNHYRKMADLAKASAKFW